MCVAGGGDDEAFLHTCSMRNSPPTCHVARTCGSQVRASAPCPSIDRHPAITHCSRLRLGLAGGSPTKLLSDCAGQIRRC